MLAGARVATETAAPVPVELSQAWQFERFGVLPYAGGARDQEPGQLTRMAIIYDAWFAYSSFLSTRLTGAEWQRQNGQYWKLIQEIEALDG